MEQHFRGNEQQFYTFIRHPKYTRNILVPMYSNTGTFGMYSHIELYNFYGCNPAIYLSSASRYHYLQRNRYHSECYTNRRGWNVLIPVVGKQQQLQLTIMEYYQRSHQQQLHYSYPYTNNLL